MSDETALELAYAWLDVAPRSRNPEFEHIVWLLRDFQARLTAIEGPDFSDDLHLDKPYPDLRHCPHDGQTCTHDCEGDSCWREVDGS